MHKYSIFYHFKKKKKDQLEVQMHHFRVDYIDKLEEKFGYIPI